MTVITRSLKEGFAIHDGTGHVAESVVDRQAAVPVCPVARGGVRPIDFSAVVVEASRGGKLSTRIKERR